MKALNKCVLKECIWSDFLVSNMGDSLAGDTHQGGERGRRRRALELGFGLVESIQNVQVGSWRVRSGTQDQDFGLQAKIREPSSYCHWLASPVVRHPLLKGF